MSSSGYEFLRQNLTLTGFSVDDSLLMCAKELLDNALDACRKRLLDASDCVLPSFPYKPEVRLSLSSVPIENVDPSIFQSSCDLSDVNYLITLSVCDSGCGISNDTLSYLQHAFGSSKRPEYQSSNSFASFDDTSFLNDENPLNYVGKFGIGLKLVLLFASQYISDVSLSVKIRLAEEQVADFVLVLVDSNVVAKECTYSNLSIEQFPFLTSFTTSFPSKNDIDLRLNGYLSTMQLYNPRINFSVFHAQDLTTVNDTDLPEKRKLYDDHASNNNLKNSNNSNSDNNSLNNNVTLYISLKRFFDARYFKNIINETSKFAYLQNQKILPPASKWMHAIETESNVIVWNNNKDIHNHAYQPYYSAENIHHSNNMMLYNKNLMNKQNEHSVEFSSTGDCIFFDGKKQTNFYSFDPFVWDMYRWKSHASNHMSNHFRQELYFQKCSYEKNEIEQYLKDKKIEETQNLMKMKTVDFLPDVKKKKASKKKLKKIDMQIKISVFVVFDENESDSNDDLSLVNSSINLFSDELPTANFMRPFDNYHQGSQCQMRVPRLNEFCEILMGFDMQRLSTFSLMSPQDQKKELSSKKASSNTSDNLNTNTTTYNTFNNNNNMNSNNMNNNNQNNRKTNTTNTNFVKDEEFDEEIVKFMFKPTDMGCDDEREFDDYDEENDMDTSNINSAFNFLLNDNASNSNNSLNLNKKSTNFDALCADSDFRFFNGKIDAKSLSSTLSSTVEASNSSSSNSPSSNSSQLPSICVHRIINGVPLLNNEALNCGVVKSINDFLMSYGDRYGIKPLGFRDEIAKDVLTCSPKHQKLINDFKTKSQQKEMKESMLHDMFASSNLGYVEVLVSSLSSSFKSVYLDNFDQRRWKAIHLAVHVDGEQSAIEWGNIQKSFLRYNKRIKDCMYKVLHKIFNELKIRTPREFESVADFQKRIALNKFLPSITQSIYNIMTRSKNKKFQNACSQILKLNTSNISELNKLSVMDSIKQSIFCQIFKQEKDVKKQVALNKPTTIINNNNIHNNTNSNTNNISNNNTNVNQNNNIIKNSNSNIIVNQSKIKSSSKQNNLSMYSQSTVASSNLPNGTYSQASSTNSTSNILKILLEGEQTYDIMQILNHTESNLNNTSNNNLNHNSNSNNPPSSTKKNKTGISNRISTETAVPQDNYNGDDTDYEAGNNATLINSNIMCDIHNYMNSNEHIKLMNEMSMPFHNNASQ